MINSFRTFIHIIGLASLLVTLAGQSNALWECQRQTAVGADIPESEVNVREDQNSVNGGYRFSWEARNRNGRTISGYCEANRNGRIVRFEQTQGRGGGGNRGGWNSRDR